MNILGHSIDRLASVDPNNAFRMLSSKRLEATSEILVEADVGLFDTIAFAARLGALEADFDIEVEPEGEIGSESLGGDLVQLVDQMQVEAASVALVGDR